MEIDFPKKRKIKTIGIGVITGLMIASIYVKRFYINGNQIIKHTDFLMKTLSKPTPSLPDTFLITRNVTDWINSHIKIEQLITNAFGEFKHHYTYIHKYDLSVIGTDSKYISRYCGSYGQLTTCHELTFLLDYNGYSLIELNSEYGDENLINKDALKINEIISNIIGY